MTMRLWVQLAAAFILVILGVVLITMLLAQATITTDVHHYAQQERQGAQVAVLADYYEQTGQWDGVNTVLQTITPGGHGMGGGSGRQMGRALLVLTDPAGNIIASNRANLTSVSLDELVAMPVEVGDNVVGIVYMDTPGQGSPMELSSGTAQMLAAVTKSLWVAGLLATLAGIVLSVLLAQRIAAPLGHVAHAAHRIAGGDLAQQVEPSGSAEVAEMAAAFNQMSASLQQAEQARRNLLADVAHELRTPISVLQGNLGALLDNVYPTSQAEIATLYDEVLLLNRLVTDVRDLAQAEVGRLRVDRQPTDVAALATRLTMLFAEVGTAQDVTVQAEGPATLPPVQADPARVEQVLSNLLTNALRHTPAGGTITVQVQGTDEGVMVAVHDTGHGIAEADLPHIFDRYWHATPESRQSSGLGLAIARQLVLAQGGRIGVESKRGQGSRFWFVLPY